MNAIHNMTWEEVGQLICEGVDGAILPIGATEQHGPHLGCGMDAEIADVLCKAVAEKTNVALLPLLPYGCSIGHSKRWPGTMALQPKTLIDVVKEIGDWVYASGFRRLYLVNTHVGNHSPLRCALEMLRAEYNDFMVALINSATMSERVRKKHFADAADWHANDAETSLMMAVSPHIVRDQKRHTSDDVDRTTQRVFSHPVNKTSKNGVTGTPSLASAGKGEELFQWMVDDLAALIVRGQQEHAPLNFSYNVGVYQE